jgi:hypothetical protein
MKDLLDEVLYGVLPTIATTLLLFGIGGRRWLELALGASVFGAYAALKKEVPAWPVTLYAGNNDGNQWWVWSVVGCGLAALPVSDDRPPRWLRLPLGVLLLAAEVWFMLTNRRARMGAGDAWSEHLFAIVLLAAIWLGMRRSVERRDGMVLAGCWAVCLVGDSIMLLNGHSALLAQLAGTVVAALATAMGTALWQRPFRLGAPTVLALAAAHGGLLLAGVHFGDLRDEAAVFAGLAPAAFVLAGPPNDRAGALRFAGAAAIAGVLLATAIWRSTISA